MIAQHLGQRPAILHLDALRLAVHRHANRRVRHARRDPRLGSLGLDNRRSRGGHNSHSGAFYERAPGNSALCLRLAHTLHLRLVELN